MPRLADGNYIQNTQSAGEGGAVIWLGFAGWVMLMACWLGHLEYRRRCRIATCEHRRGEVLSVDDRFGSAEYLVWACADCPFQAPLGELQAMPGRDRFWYTRGIVPWEVDRDLERSSRQPVPVERERGARDLADGFRPDRGG